MSRPVISPPGMIWVCSACGRTGRDRYLMGDSSCMTWAVLCRAGGPPWKAVEPAMAGAMSRRAFWRGMRMGFDPATWRPWQFTVLGAAILLAVAIARVVP